MPGSLREVRNMKKKNEAFVPKKNEPCGAYILHALEDHFLNGDAYTTDDEAIHICMQAAHRCV